MLYLLARHGSDTFAIAGACIQRVLPFVRLKNLPSEFPGVAGALNFEGRSVPVLDLSSLLGAGATPARLSTRIVLIDLALGSDVRLIGLIAGKATALERIECFHPPGVDSPARRWLGPVADVRGELVQRIEIADLLPPPLIAALVRGAEATVTA